MLKIIIKVYNCDANELINNNQDFNSIEFDGIKNEARTNRF